MTEENQSSAVRKHNNKWRVVDIVVAAIIAVASGVIFWGWDIVCTAPLAHAAVIGELLDHDLPVFTELNLVSDGYRENMARLKSGDLYEVARVIKGLLYRERRRGLSNGERKMLHSAKQILLSELVLAEDSGYEEVERRVERAMLQTPEIQR